VGDVLSRLAHEADLVAVIAPKLAVLCHPFVERRIDLAMITPSVPAEAMRFLSYSQILIGNLFELADGGRRLGLDIEKCDEDDSDAVESAAEVVKVLGRVDCGGLRATVCTIGRHGAVVALPESNEFYHIRPLSPAPMTRSGAGDADAASMLLHSWEKPESSPVVWAALAAIDLGEWLGADGPEVEVSRLNASGALQLAIKAVFS
jgi:sugar/nucleoside kinase (ribokinase family)